MAYYTNLFSPETYEAFTRSEKCVSGFKPRLKNVANKIEPGSILVCYVTKISRWIGLLEVTGRVFEDDTPVFQPNNDPYVIRLPVRVKVWLPKDKAVPIREDCVWDFLSFTRNHSRTSSVWTGKLRSSLNLLSNEDGKFLENLLKHQKKAGQTYELSKDDYRRMVRQKVRGGYEAVSKNDSKESIHEQTETDVSTIRESYHMQALLAKIGEVMGFSVWIPRNDRSNVSQEWKPKDGVLLNTLPLSYDEKTIKTIEQIDVLWLRNRSIVRAFEVEHSTAIYSGILRMADLLALQPNMDIRLHIVAPESRKKKVIQEIKRPVFSVLERGPLFKICTFVSYESVTELSNERHLSHMSDAVLETYTGESESVG